jgi:hypothetical protein
LFISVWNFKKTRAVIIPYIKSDDNRREKLRAGEPALTAGELNYQIFYYVKHNCQYILVQQKQLNIIRCFIEQFLGEKPNYQKYNDMTGCLIRCKKEIERRLDIEADELLKIMESYDDEITKYEDKKIIENGDID